MLQPLASPTHRRTHPNDDRQARWRLSHASAVDEPVIGAPFVTTANLVPLMSSAPTCRRRMSLMNQSTQNPTVRLNFTGCPVCPLSLPALCFPPYTPSATPARFAQDQFPGWRHPSIMIFFPKPFTQLLLKVARSDLATSPPFHLGAGTMHDPCGDPVWLWITIPANKVNRLPDALILTSATLSE